MQQKRATLKDIAREAGVGLGTASRVINKNQSVKEKARVAVLDAMKRLNYTPNAIARSLKTSSTNTIGVILPDILNPFYPEVVRGVEDVSNIYNYNIFLCNTDKDSNRISESIDIFKEKKVDGIIFIGNSMQDFRVEQLKEMGVPVVTICTSDYKGYFPSVTIDNEKAAEMAVEYLHKLGHTEIAIVAGNDDVRGTGFPRLTGYMNYMNKNNLKINEDWIIKGDYLYQKAYEGVKEIFAKSDRPSAVFASSDMMAIATARAILESGLSIPGDVSIIGMDGLEFTEYYYPAITTVKQHRYDMGAVGMRMMTKLLHGEEVLDKHILIDCELIERNSCRSI